MSVNLRSILGKYTKNDAVNELVKLDCVVKRNLHLKSYFKEVRSKPEIINAIVHKLETLQHQDENIIRDVSAELELILHMRRSRKQWTVYKFHYAKGHKALQKTLDPDVLQETLSEKLGIGFKSHCIYKLEDAVVWLRIALCDRSFRPEKNATMFAVHHLVPSFIVVTNIVTYMKEAIFSVLSSLFKFASARDTGLVGKCALSLIHLAEDKETHGIHNTSSEQRTLTKSRSTKRKAPEIIEVAHLVSLQQAEKRQRRNYVVNTFGTEEQPLLQTLNYVLETDFCGSRRRTEEEQFKGPFNCRVTFSGPSVLNGLREMVDAGIISYPLPRTLRSVKSLKRNKWKITKSDR